MKSVILALTVAVCGSNFPAAAELEDIKAAAGAALTINASEAAKTAGVLPAPVFRAVELTEPDKAAAFQASCSWNSPNGNGFTALKQLGVRKDAEEKAIAKCQAEGLLGCVAIGSNIDSCNAYNCGATGRALSLIPVAGAPVFSASSDWNSGDGKGFGALEQLGIRKDAEEKALAKCQAEGLLGCVAIGSNIDSCNAYNCGATGRAQLQTNPK
ncbi:MAG: hypothetical protein WCW52_12280 [Elusimicrobiales bacterium]|jgi:hypothetical protein